jgi:hypothetical protein
MELLTAQTHALLAIAERLDQPRPTSGTCTAILDTGYGIQPYEGCDHPHGHTGAHRATNNGDTRWTDQSPGAGHINTPANTTFDTQPAPDTLNTEPGWTAPTTGTYQLSTGQEPRPICGAPNPAQPDMICDDVPHHYGVHDHLRTWWPADHYPPGAGPCGIPTDTYDCRLYSGHPGPCDTTNDHRRS